LAPRSTGDIAVCSAGQSTSTHPEPTPWLAPKIVQWPKATSAGAPSTIFPK
jgi:hypothetical protein